MARRRIMQRPGIARPNMAGNAGRAGIGRKPRIGRANPASLAMSGRAARQSGAMPAGMKPKTALSGLSRIIIIGSLMKWIERIFFPKAHLRVMKRKRVGTGLDVIRQRALTSRRSRLPVTRKQAAILRNRTLGLSGTIASQHARGRIHGVRKYPGQKAA